MSFPELQESSGETQTNKLAEIGLNMGCSKLAAIMSFCFAHFTLAEVLIPKYCEKQYRNN